jgi:hypothetical protein
MSHLLQHAQNLINTIILLMPSTYQQKSLEAMMGLFLQGTGRSLPQHATTVSPSAISRFLNHYNWSCRGVIRAMRRAVREQLKTPQTPGGRATLKLILDMTTIEKTGKFKGLGTLLRVYNGKEGLHLLVLYIVLGNWRLPWGFRVYRGKNQHSHIELAVRLLHSLPESLTKSYQVLVLVDTAFGSIDFINTVRSKGWTLVAGIRSDRRLDSGKPVDTIARRGTLVYLYGLSKPVTLSWYWLKRDNGTRIKRYVISTKPYSWSYISRLGRQRWAIETFFKIVKHRFCLHCFGQKTIRGIYRFLVLSMIAYVLAHWAILWSNYTSKPDWGQAARTAVEHLFPQLVLSTLILHIRHLTPLARQHGLQSVIRGYPRDLIDIGARS